MGGGCFSPAAGVGGYPGCPDSFRCYQGCGMERTGLCLADCTNMGPGFNSDREVEDPALVAFLM